jgi:hypothetical protein
MLCFSVCLAAIHPGILLSAFSDVLSKKIFCGKSIRLLFSSWVVYGCLYLANLKLCQEIYEVVILYMVWTVALHFSLCVLTFQNVI